MPAHPSCGSLPQRELDLRPQQKSLRVGPRPCRRTPRTDRGPEGVPTASLGWACSHAGPCIFRHTLHTDRAHQGPPPTASVGILELISVHPLRGSWPIRSSSYCPSARNRTQSPADFGTPSQCSCPGCSSRSPSGSPPMRSPAQIRHTPQADRVPAGAPPTAPVGGFACGPRPNSSPARSPISGPNERVRMRARAHFGTLLTRIAPHREPPMVL